MPRTAIVIKGAKVRQINLSRKAAKCPSCGKEGRRHSLGHRWIYDLGLSKPALLNVTYSKHFCSKCDHFFNISMEQLAMPGSSFTNRVTKTAMALVMDKDMTLTGASELLQQKYHVHVPMTTLHGWVAAETKAPQRAAG